MKAMVLCAGLGTRLRPWTLHHPKALVPVGGVPMLKRVADTLVSNGFDEITVNVHHFADQIESFIGEGSLGAKINISDETSELLDTGGGILNAERFLAGDDSPFLVHNVDILSNADLKGLYQIHINSGSDVTLLVSDRASSRRLVFDKKMNLKGWTDEKSGAVRPDGLKIDFSDISLAFSGIYIMSPRIFNRMRLLGLHGSFPIMDFFLSSDRELKIAGVFQPDLELIDIGKPDTLHRANLSIQ